MKRAFHRHAQSVLSCELQRLKHLSPGERARVERVSATVVVAAVERILEEARGEPRLAEALASIYQPERKARSTLPAWPAEAARRG
jgi:hypothetical protein